MNRHFAYASAFLLAVALVSSAGCSGTDGPPRQGVSIQGKLVNGGQPVALESFSENYTYLELTFLPASPGGAGGIGIVGADGTFTVPDIKPGEYKVGITKYVDAQNVWEGKHEAKDSPLTVTVAEGQELVVDLKDIPGAAPN